MQNITAELFGDELKAELKNRGFKKNRLYWHKEEKDLTIIFFIQKSQWGKDVWYYQYGVEINALHDKPGYTFNYIDIGTRFDQLFRWDIVDPCLRSGLKEIFGDNDRFRLTPEDLFRILDFWTDEFGSMEKIKNKKTKAEFPWETWLRTFAYLFGNNVVD